MLLNKEILIGIYSYINTLTGSWVWVGLGSNNNWSTGSNWDMNISPPPYNALYFGGSTRLTPFNDLTINTPFNGINFNVGASSFTLSGNSFMLYSGGIVNNSANLQTIANNILLSGTGGIVVDSAASDITLTGTITGTNLLIKTGNNILTLSGANTYSGNTTISAGMLKAGSTTGLSISSAFSVITGATLDLNGYNSTIRGFTSTTANGTVTNTGSAAKLTLATQLGSSATVSSIAQLFTGNLTLQFWGAEGSTILTNANNTYNGGTILGNGTGGNITTRVLFNQEIIVGSGSPGAITSGLFGTAPITVGGSISDRAQLYFGGGQTLNYNTIVNSELGDGRFIGAFRIEGSNITLAGTISANQADAIFSVNNQAGRTATVTGAIKGDYGVRVVSMSATTTATGSLTLTLANTGVNVNDYSGNTTLSGTGKATLRLGASNQIPNGPGKGNLNALSGTFNMNGFNETINGLSGAGIVDGGTGNPTLTIGDNDTSSTFAGIIKNTAGSLSAIKTGTGTLTLTANNNTYNGSTSINAGAISVTQGIATALFTSSPTLTATFSTLPSIGQTYRFFPGITVQSYPSVTLIGAPGRTGSYNSPTSTLTIA
jgi:autotransporter-associated beta strand protein